VADALRADLDWIREHTRLAEAARRWHERGQLEALLLRDDELTAAQAWKARRRSDAPEFTDGQLALIAASQDAAAARQELERQQRDEFARAQTARAEALADRERAVATLQRRTILAGIGAGIFSCGIGGLGYWTWLTQGRLRDERVRADRAQAASLDAAVAREAGRTDLAGQISAFAASPGQLASDGVAGEETSPYTKRLLDKLAKADMSLQQALAAASREVLLLTKSAQRPYLATDLNGDLYLQKKPASRHCKAIVAAVDQTGTTRFANVLRDGTAWAAFLQKCGFEVIHLANPTYQQVISTIDQLRFEGASERLAFGTRPKFGTAPDPPPNTCLLFFFSGGGIRDGNALYLLASDSMNAKDFIVPQRAIDVGRLSTVMREAAAASVLVLDTAFPDPARG
jgi:hypothetical protein